MTASIVRQFYGQSLEDLPIVILEAYNLIYMLLLSIFLGTLQPK